MTEAEFWQLIARLFCVEQSQRLEKKGWFRFVKVLQGIAIVLVVLISLGVGYFTFDAKSTATATLICNDGTKWNAIDEKESYGTYKSELDLYEKCGMCNYRSTDGRYSLCKTGEQSNILFDSYEIDRTYTRDNSFLAVLAWVIGVLLGGLLIVKFTAKAIVYIIGGGDRDN